MSVSFCIFVLVTTFIVGGVQCRQGEEPSCSVFDYNEKILSKLVRMEHNMELNQKRLETWEDTLSIPTVAFKARNVATNAPSAGSKIVYTEIVLNDGDGYTSATGDFKAPHDGLYFFTVQICTYARAWVRAHIIADDKVIGTVSNYEDSTGETCTSGNGMAVLAAGDVVWVKCLTLSGNGMYQNNNIWNSFSGMLVHN